MLIPPRPLSTRVLTKYELESDKETVNKYEDCGLGKKALYVGAFGLNRRRYIPIGNVKRVYKRLAVSKGFFESGKMFITVSYLVIEYDGGKRKTCRFTHEENLDLLLSSIKSRTAIHIGKKK